MVVRFEYMWVSIPLLMAPMLFVLLQMILIRIWMLTAPVKVRERPDYSLHVMREPKEKPKKIVFTPQQPVIPARTRGPVSTYQVANAPHVYRSMRSGYTSMGTSGFGTPTGYMTPSHQFQQYQSGSRPNMYN